MAKLNPIFERIEKLTRNEGHNDFISVIKSALNNDNESLQNKDQGSYNSLKLFLHKIFDAVDEIATEVKHDDTILISVKNQKLLRTCYQLIASLGVSTCLIPGLGINLTKRCSSAIILPSLMLTDEQKYEILVSCTDFFKRSYDVPVLKNIVLTLHLSDYLAALIQLSFAPLKKPGTYKNFVMTQDLFEKLNGDRQKYVEIYNHLVANCFQPMLMKELLVLQSVTDPSPPIFVRKVITKELSQRLLAPGGLLSLIRCFIETYDIDVGFEWKKINMICRIISTKHGSSSELEYLKNICSQLKHILCLNNTHYLTTGVACVLCLNDKYSHADPVISLVKEIFDSFDYNKLNMNSYLPGTMILSPQEVDRKINVFHACVCTTELDWPIDLLVPNMHVLYLIGLKCTKNNEMRMKVRDIIMKCLEKINKEEVCNTLKMFLFDEKHSNCNFIIEEYDAGVAVKAVQNKDHHQNDEAVLYFINLFKAMIDSILVQNIFTASLTILIELDDKRHRKANKDMLLIEEDPILLDNIDQQYATILQILSEISTSPKVIASLKSNPAMVFDFIEHFILKNNEDECYTIALVLLNTILAQQKSQALEKRFKCLIPVLRKMAEDELNLNNILCKEILSVINSETPRATETAYGKAIAAVFDNLLPVRAHGIMELTKLIDSGDSETLSKKHFIFCLFQEQLKDSDSYIYLAAINGLASLCTYCTEDVLHLLCKEYLHVSSEPAQTETKDCQNKMAELRMKIGDIIVKVTKRLGEMAVVYKTILLNTVLCACRDDDPLIRTSALSNLAEISLVLNYKIGTIIYEILHCIWSTLETDKAIECRRAAVLVISSLIKGLGKETLIQLKENILPIYRSLKALYRDTNEDSTVRLHAQIALEELNDVVNQFLFPKVEMEKQIFVLDKPEEVFK